MQQQAEERQIPPVQRWPAQDPNRANVLVQVMFPSTEVELPSPDRYNAFPPEAQTAILASFKKEQETRHHWIHQQQHNDHVLNIAAQKFNFSYRLAGICASTFLALGSIGIGAWMIVNGAPLLGVAFLFSAVAGLVGTAIYGHKAQQAAKMPPKEKS